MLTRSALAALAAGLAIAPVYAQSGKTVLGTLTCTGVEGERNRFASETVVLSCLFRDSDGGYAETYAGTLRRYIGAHPIDRSIVLIWTVSGDPGTLAPGILEQSYLGKGVIGDPESWQLHGQRNASIVLRAFIQADHAAEHSVMVLDLDLELTRA